MQVRTNYLIKIQIYFILYITFYNLEKIHDLCCIQFFRHEVYETLSGLSKKLMID